MAYNIIDIEGIGPVYAEKLGTVGIKTVEALLEAGASKKGRDEIAEKTGIAYAHILRWVNMADLFRIKGVAEETSDLLEKAGVDTVKELRNRNAENLHAKLVAVNEEFNLSGRVPSLSQVEGFIAQAKELAPTVTH
jgi:predicted flap endonuclease-1-like 5' DNA nuclease